MLVHDGDNDDYDDCEDDEYDCMYTSIARVYSRYFLKSVFSAVRAFYSRDMFMVQSLH